jgi:hypothetical protein
MSRRRWWTGAAGGLLAAGTALALGAYPAVAQTDPAPTTPPSTEAAVVAAMSTTTLPLFGAPLTVDVSTTPSGSLADVAVNPADGLTATKVHPNQVVFVNDAKTGKVRVETRHGSEKTGVVAGALSDIVGQGGWSGDVFGTGAKTSVLFTIGAAADGGPDITGITSSDASAVIGDVQHNNGDEIKVARATVTFTSGIQTRRLTITVSVFSVGDKTRAGSQVTLSRISGTALPADQAAGAHTWSGMLCDGSTATVAYTVGADGTITAGAVTPAGATAGVQGNVLLVRFSPTESVRIVVQGKGGDLKISAVPSLRCQRTVPSVNTPTSTVAPHQDRHPDSVPDKGSVPATTDPRWSGGRDRGDH